MKKLVRRGQKIIAENGKKYLIIRVTPNSLDCMDENFNHVAIGVSYIRDFYDADDGVDMPKWVSWLMEEGETYGKDD